MATLSSLRNLTSSALQLALFLAIFTGLWAFLFYVLSFSEMSLAALLQTGGAVSLAFLILATVFSSSLQPRSSKLLVIVYALTVCAVCVVGVYQFVGTAEYRSPAIPIEKQLRFSHAGYYVGRGQQFTFSDMKAADGFYHPALGAGEKIVLDPTTMAQDGQWRLQYRARNFPLRLSGKIVNAPEAWWLNPGDVVKLQKSDGANTSFFHLKLQIEPAGIWKSASNIYEYSQGTVNNATRAEQFTCRDLKFSQRVLQEGYRLSIIAGQSQSKEFRDCVEQGDWWPVFEKMIVVRELQNDTSSRLGIFFDEEVIDDPAIEIYKNSERLSAPPDEVTAPLQIPSNATVDYGFDKRRLSLALTSQIANDPSWGQVSEILLRPKPSWPLPPSINQPFIITSSKDFIPLDGYFIDLGDGSALLSMDDVVNWPGLYSKLKADSERPQPSPGKRVMEVLPEGVRSEVTAEAHAGELKRSRKARFIKALNDALERKDFYRKEEFAQVLTEDIRKLLDEKSNLPNRELVRLNRLLLEAYFKQEIAKHPGDAAQPFYARAKFDAGKAASGQETVLSVNGGGLRSNQGTQIFGEYKFGEHVRLGKGQKGVILTLEECRAAFPYPGLRIIMTLLGAFLTFAVAVRLWPENHWQWPRSAAWAGIWATTLIILTVRVIISYRISLLPPDDATPRQLLNVFDKSLEQSWVALLVIPLVIALAPPLSRFAGIVMQSKLRNYASGSMRARNQEFFVRAVAFAVVVLAIALWLLSGWLGGRESVRGIRLNLVAHVLIVISLIVNARYLIATPQPSRRWAAILATALLIVATTVVMLFGIGDLGFMIYCLSYLIFFFATFTWPRPSWVYGLSMGLLLCAVLGALFYFLPHLPYVQKVFFPVLPDRAYFRLASYTKTEEEILFQRSAERNLDVDSLMKNMQQNWQMLQYAAYGGKEGKGFGQVPPSKVAMTYPTSVADCAFAMYLLSEHGSKAGWLFLSHFILLALFCFYGAIFLPANYQHRLLPLIAIGAFFVCNALYVASANAGLVVFTGQNIPLLSFYSGTDWVQSAILLGLALLLLYLFQNGVTLTSRKIGAHQAALSLFSLIILLGSTLWLYSIAGQLQTLASDVSKPEDNPFLKDHNFSPKFYADIESHLPSLSVPGYNSRLLLKEVAGDAGNYIIESAPGSTTIKSETNEIEELYINKFNKLGKSRKYSEDAGLYHLENVNLPDRNPAVGVTIDKNYFKLPSPLSQELIWNGVIAPRDAFDAPTFAALGSSFAVSLSGEGYAKTISLEGAAPSVTNRTVNIMGRGYTFGTLERDATDPNTVQLQVKQPERAGSWSVHINGEPINGSKKLEQHDMIVIDSGERRWNLMYLGLQGMVMAHVQWRNGSSRRLYPQGEWFPLVYSIGKAGDQLTTPKQKPPAKLELSIDFALQKSLQETVEDYARGNATYAASDPLKTNKLAVTIMDAHNGEVLALPSWPAKNPADSDFEIMLQEATSREEARLLENHNLTLHSVGSTVKPLVFSGVASQFWPDKDVGQIVAYNRPDAGEGRHPHTSLAGLCISGWDCLSDKSPINAESFLVHSLDYYEGTIGMLGMLFEPKDWEKVLVPNRAAPDVQYGGQQFAFDLRKVDNANTPFTLADKCPTLLTDAMNKPLLFKGLNSYFNVAVGTGTPEERFNEQKNTCKDFLPSFWSTDLKPQTNNHLDQVLPEPVIFIPRRWQTIRGDVISFILGGGPGRWNNIKMAEAATALATGKRVSPHLERIIPVPASVTLPPPISDHQWRNKNLISPMMRVAEAGTAARLKGLVPQPYRLMCKTGTIEERENGRESEFLIFVIGKFENGEFVPGQTVSGFFYMEDSKTDKGAGEKLNFGKLIIEKVVAHLKQRATSSNQN